MTGKVGREANVIYLIAPLLQKARQAADETTGKYVFVYGETGVKTTL
jgi:hypothetical protein